MYSGQASSWRGHVREKYSTSWRGHAFDAAAEEQRLRVRRPDAREFVVKDAGGHGGTDFRPLVKFAAHHFAIADNVGQRDPARVRLENKTDFQGSIWFQRLLGVKQQSGAADILGRALRPFFHSTQPVLQRQLQGKARRPGCPLLNVFESLQRLFPAKCRPDYKVKMVATSNINRLGS